MTHPPAAAVGSKVLRVLFVLANPTDMPRFDDAQLWNDIRAGVEPLVRQGHLEVERCVPATETALRQRLARADVDLLYLVTRGKERAAARYAALELEGSDGRARNLTMTSLLALLAANQGIRSVLLQASGQDGSEFALITEALVDRGLAVTVVPSLYGPTQRLFVGKLVAALVGGLNADGLRHELVTALANTGGASPRVVSRDCNTPIFERQIASPSAPMTASALPAASHHISVEPFAEELKRKRAAGIFDVFLCHNSADKPAVMRVGHGLRSRGVLPWLDAWELPPGQPWQPLLERQIDSIRSAAVFIGAAGIGPWQEQEMHSFLRELVSRKIPVIPTLLLDAPSTPELPVFLRGVTWVDLRAAGVNALDLLVWGITGTRPYDS